MTRLELLKAMVKDEKRVKQINEALHPCDIYVMPDYCKDFNYCKYCKEKFWNEEVEI